MRGAPHRRSAVTRTAGAAVVASLAVTLAGCSLELLPPASELGDAPQVLAVRADPPEANPGDLVTLDALVHWPGDDWEAHWIICIPQSESILANCVGDSFPADGVVADCLTAPPDAPLCRAPSGPITQVVVPPFLQLPPDVTFPVFVELVAARASVGWAGCADAVANAAPTPDCLLAIKTLWLSSDPVPNVDPVPVALVADGVTHDASAPLVIGADASDLADVSVELELVVDATSVDEVFPDDASPVEASLWLAWFVTCGSIDVGGFGAPQGDASLDPADVNCAPPADGVGPPTCEPARATWKPRTPGTCTVHAVVRDGHGGVGHLTRVFEVRGVAAPPEDNTLRACNCRAGPGALPTVLPGALLVLLSLLGLSWRRRRLSRRGDPGC